MRAIWTGAIGFGLVNIPVKLFSAVEESELELDMLDKKDLANIKYQRINERTGKVVPYENIVKGFKVKDQYVVLTDDDFQQAMPEKTKTIEISSFAMENEIDSMYYEKPYFLEPDKSGARAYGLLLEALKKTGKVGLGSFVLRSKESLCLIKVSGNVLILQKIRFVEELRQPGDLNIPKETPKPAELKMALTLINQLTKEFNIKDYKDTYSGKLMKLIEAKAKGKKLAVPSMKVVHSTTQDLMEQLKASLDHKRKAS
ncbi:MAG TPA: Ku protein [Chitinophagaceae bacterium]|nr:Ku protein [Chitinophagaceae bacterium]